MFDQPEQIRTLATIHRQAIKAEIDHWRLATAVLKAQRATSKDQPSQLDKLCTLVGQFFHKLARPTWATAGKHS